MKLLFAHVAENAIIAKSNNISIIEIFNTILIKDVPTIHPKMVVVAGLQLDRNDDNKEFDLRFTLKDPESRMLRQTDGHIKTKVLPGMLPRVNLSLPFDVVQLSSVGLHVIEIELDGSLLQTLEINVVRLEDAK